MEEQVPLFNKLFPWLKAVYLSDSQPDPSVAEQVRRGDVDVLYGSPETLLSPSWLNVLSSSIYSTRMTSIVVDECHAVNKWGHDFRPLYAQIYQLRARVGNHVPIIACTATLTPKARTSVATSIGLQDYTTIELSINRPNIFLARESYCSDEDGHLTLITRLVRQLKHFGARTPRLLVYTRTKEQARQLAMALADQIGQHCGLTGVALVNWYHAGLSDEARRDILADFSRADSQVRVLFSSNALGMGSDLKGLYAVWVIDAPDGLDDWLQMLGRAGRDGQQSVATLFFDSSRFGRISKEMKAYCQSNTCLRLRLARFFDPLADPAEFRAVYDNSTDEQIAARCCVVCSLRQSTVDPPQLEHAPENSVQRFSHNQ
jgi:superfamily II DNA helicase RecQ